MKKVVLFLFFIIAFNKTNAQIVFCPPGAEWHFLQKKAGSNFSTPWIYPNETIKYVRDTLINSFSAKVLSHTFFYKDNSQICTITLIRQNGDTVFMRNNYSQHNWQILYNYNAAVGQSWINSFLATPGSTVAIRNYTTTVDSIKIITENGFSLKKLFVKQLSSTSQYAWPSTITERYGSNKFLFNFSTGYDLGSADPIFYDWVEEFLCYADSTFGTKQFSSKDCNYQNLVGIKSYNINSESINIYPNPAKIKLIIEVNSFENSDFKMELINSLGQLVNTVNTLHQKQEIALSEFPTGIYFLKLQNNSDQKVFKIIKE